MAGQEKTLPTPLHGVLRGSGPGASEQLLLSAGGYDNPMPKFATPFIDDALREEVAFFKQWGFLVVEDAITVEQVAKLSDGAAYLSELFAT